MRRLPMPLLSLTLALLPALASAHDWHCAGGDNACLIASLSRAQTRPDREHTLHLGAGTFTLTQENNTDGDEGGNGLPAIVGTVTIRGAGQDQTIIERDPTAPLFRLLWILAGADVTLQGLTVQGGELDPAFFFRAGGIANFGTLTLKNVRVRNNSAWLAGGIGNRGTLHLVDSVVEHNASDIAGGIGNNGVLTVRRSVIDGNVADEEAGLGVAPGGDVAIDRTVLSNNTATRGSGGGMGGVCATCTLRRSTFVDNFAGSDGGGIQATDGRWELRDVAIVRNTSEVFAGGMRVDTATVEGHRVTIAGNTAQRGLGGGLLNSGGDVRLQASTLAGNQAPLSPDCFGALTLQGRRNIVGDPRGCVITEER